MDNGPKKFIVQCVFLMFTLFLQLALARAFNDGSVFVFFVI